MERIKKLLGIMVMACVSKTYGQINEK